MQEAGREAAVAHHVCTAMPGEPLTRRGPAASTPLPKHSGGLLAGPLSRVAPVPDQDAARAVSQRAPNVRGAASTTAPRPASTPREAPAADCLPRRLPDGRR